MLLVTMSQCQDTKLLTRRSLTSSWTF
jgi:hypothetical protein